MIDRQTRIKGRKGKTASVGINLGHGIILALSVPKQIEGFAIFKHFLSVPSLQLPPFPMVLGGEENGD